MSVHDTRNDTEATQRNQFGTFGGVFTPCLLTILGVTTLLMQKTPFLLLTTAAACTAVASVWISVPPNGSEQFSLSAQWLLHACAVAGLILPTRRAVLSIFATAVAALGRGLPRRMRVVLQAESLINDATALVVYALAVGTATGQIEPTLTTAGGRLAVSFLGGVAVGLATGWVMFRVRRALQEPRLVNLSSVVTPLLAYLVAEEVHASGVLAVVVAGLFMAQVTPGSIAAVARQQGAAFWT